MEKHFICTGECKGVSDKPGTCQAGDCSKHERELSECSCEDSKHGRSDEN